MMIQEDFNMSAKNKKIILLFFIFIFSISCILNAAVSIKKIYFAISKELSKYSTYPPRGWVQINDALNKKYGIKIPKKYMVDAQKYYIRIVIQKLKNTTFRTFEDFENAHPIPLAIRDYAKNYFNKLYSINTIKKLDITEETKSDNVETTPQEENFNKTAASGLQSKSEIKYSLKDFDDFNIDENQSESSDFTEEKEVNKFQFQDQPKKPVYQRQRLSDIISKQGTVSTSKSSASEFSNVTLPSATYNTPAIKESLNKTKESIEVLNNLLENALKQVDMNYDQKLQEMMRRNNELNNKLNVYNEVTSKVRLLLYNFIKQTLNLEFQIPVNIDELNSSFSKISLQLDNVIDEFLKLKNENRRLMEENEILQKENYELKQKAESLGFKVETNRLYDLRLRNLRKQEKLY